MKVKAAFMGGAAVGLLAGSRMGTGLYRKVCAVASSTARNPAVRRGVGTAGGKAGDLAKSLGTGATGKARRAGRAVSRKVAERRRSKHAESAADEEHDGRPDGSGPSYPLGRVRHGPLRDAKAEPRGWHPHPAVGAEEAMQPSRHSARNGSSPSDNGVR